MRYLLALIAAVLFATAAAAQNLSTSSPQIYVGSSQSTPVGASTPVQWNNLGVYSHVHLSCSNLQVATNGAYIFVRVGEGGVFQTGNEYVYSNNWMIIGASPTAGQTGANNTGALNMTNDGVNGMSNISTIQGSVELDMPINPAGAYSRINWHSMYTDTSNNTAVSMGGGLMFNDTNTLTDLEILPSTGNWAGGKCLLTANY